ncbi:F0F1 ATP synthase subunit B' [Helicobacter anatolicus]|uniref:F0F1 ATP synthase subunit B family protein n=1 Tax=Helicobacter anatolicus TaxID=2905874 RepID=UPI001E2CF144|nr:F0F1 ATP synthase subunit B' [Helicobacter anatolicus]MCE3039839.1 F0F1 ATP synthase subunit B' [Helicobacter anatolicus]
MSTEINLRLMFLVFVVFIATLYLLNIWLFKPLMHFMERRDGVINQDAQEITDSEKEVIYIQEEIEQIIKQAKLDAKQMTEEALSEAKNVYDSKIARYKAENQAKIDGFMQKLEEEKKLLKTQLVGDKIALQEAIYTKIKNI